MLMGNDAVTMVAIGNDGNDGTGRERDINADNIVTIKQHSCWSWHPITIVAVVLVVTMVTSAR
jgi:hypothetical protein